MVTLAARSDPAEILSSMVGGRRPLSLLEDSAGYAYPSTSPFLHPFTWVECLLFATPNDFEPFIRGFLVCQHGDFMAPRLLR